MNTSVYKINKGINRSIEFRGLKAQYIWYLGGGLLVLLILFAILYISGLNSFICIAIVTGLGTVLFIKIYHLSNRYGEHGLMKRMAKTKVPKEVKIRSRVIFCGLCKEN